MGYAIAEALRNRGAIVTLVAGPTTLEDQKILKLFMFKVLKKCLNK